MKRLVALAFALALLPLAAAAQTLGATPGPDATPILDTPAPLPAITPLPTATENPAVTKLAFQQFVSWQAGVIKRSLYTKHVQSQMTDAVIKETAQQLGSLGPLLQAKFLGPVTTDTAPSGSANYLYIMICDRGSVYMQFAIDRDGKIGGMVFRNSPP